MVPLGWFFPKTTGFTHGWIRTNQVNFMEISSKLRPASCVLMHKYVSILTSRIYNQGPSKRKTWPTPLSPLTSVWSRRCQNSHYFISKYHQNRSPFYIAFQRNVEMCECLCNRGEASYKKIPHLPSPATIIKNQWFGTFTPNVPARW